jgi:hypothetical protein
VGARVERGSALTRGYGPAELVRVIDHCKKLVAANEHAYVDPDALWVAQFVLDTLGTDFPCGFSQPRIERAPDGAVVMIDDIEFGSRDEALGIATALVRCALKLPEDSEIVSL